jgi:hypothetical protein
LLFYKLYFVISIRCIIFKGLFIAKPKNDQPLMLKQLNLNSRTMIKGLLTTLIFCIATLVTIPTMSAQDNNLENQILKQNRELVIVVVNTEGFLTQNQASGKDYKERYYNNLEWFKKNWSSFVLSVDKKESYQVKINAKKFATLSDSQKSKISQLYNSSYTGMFNPVGIAISQMHGIIYDPKMKEHKEIAYQKLRLTKENISAYTQNKNTAVLVLDTNTADHISAILSH